MNKLDLASKNIVEDNILKIQELFPNVVTEGAEGLGINFDVLKQELSNNIIDSNKERYQLTWPGKQEAIYTANTRTTKTLRPLKEKSVNFDNTENIYIEGDNLEVLKILQESYLGKIKCIYIDPPYNTGNDILYPNDYSISAEEELMSSKQIDEDGKKYIINTESNGRFHSDWLTMIFSRLKLAKNLLKEDGFIVMAIDHYELHNLRKMADEIFGEQNFLGYITIKSTPQGRGKKNIDPTGEFNIVYCKNKLKFDELKMCVDEREGEYSNLIRTGSNSRRVERPLRFYPILVKNNGLSMISDEEYKNFMKFGDEYRSELVKKYELKGFELIFPLGSDGTEKVWQRKFDRVKEEINTYRFEKGKIMKPAMLDRPMPSIWDEKKYSNVEHGSNRLKKFYFNGKTIFDFPKSVFTVQEFLYNVDENDIVLDFFSGSSTTAEACFLENSNKNKNIRWIMVQIPHQISKSDSPDAYEFCANNNLETIIPSIAQERIRRAAKKIKEETNATIDYGFRIYKVDESNMKDVYYKPNDVTQDLLDSLVSNVKEDRNKFDLLTQVILDLGLTLDLPIIERNVNNNLVMDVDNGTLLACFDDSISIITVEEMAKSVNKYGMNPEKIVVKESAFSSDQELINANEKVKNISHEIELNLI